jgi:exosortase
MDMSRNLIRLRTAAPIFVAILAVALFYSASLTTLWKKWVLWDQDLAHALPTLALMLVLLGNRSFIITDAKIAKTPWYWLQILALFSCSLLWYLFESLSISLPAYFLIILALCLFISTTLSTKTLLAVLPYLGLTLFTIPVWSELTSLLVELSSIMVGHAVKLSKLTALLDGNNIFLPSGTIYIADGCSGLRYFTIALIMGYTLILMNHYRLKGAVITLGVAIALGLLANWLRIYLLVLIGYHTDMQSSLMHDHETFGWVVFACILIPSVYFAPVSKQTGAVIQIPAHPSYLPLIPLMFGPALLYFNSSLQTDTQPLNLQYLDNYQTNAKNVVGANLAIEIPTREQRLVTINQIDARVDLFTHVPKGKKEEIVPYIGRMIDATQWSSDKQQKLITPEGYNFDVGQYKRVGDTTRILIARQYIVGQYHTASYLHAKLLQILAKATGNSYFGLLVVQTNCKSDCSEELSALPPLLGTVSKLQEN